MSKPARYLVMSGGASHGTDLWGASQVIHQRYDVIGYAAVSISAVLMAWMALGRDPNKLTPLLNLFKSNRLTGGVDVLRPHPRLLYAEGGGLHDWSHVTRELKSIFGNLRLKDCVKPLIVVVGDVYTSRPVYIDSRKHPEVVLWELLACATAVFPVADA